MTRFYETEPQPHVGQMVLYQTDGRGGLHYHLPAVVSVIDTSHAEGSPLPYPNTRELGEVHLVVLTPGGAGTYAELSVPFNPNGARRSWRWLDA